MHGVFVLRHIDPCVPYVQFTHVANAYGIPTHIHMRVDT